MATTKVTTPTTPPGRTAAATTPLPPTSIPPTSPINLLLLPVLPAHLTSPTTALRIPTTWRCGTCTTLHAVPDLLRLLLIIPTRVSSSHNNHESCCALPSLQAVYDQFGELYLFWRDDPAVSDLSVPSMAAEARWRVWRAGGGEWGAGIECGE
ncbi:hypothetical protein C8A00DRAFT_45903 [Chaetomidium leptoderma]|uniref:Uncharacterized protein n=1 Tax=Chaetomidium leptoderma TaxID=669021 RepID=A0AAN6VGD1_9PEZI|nr:hypothetical protein C8A00DRAFT_45903 [Chaetomidium leptoderma]